MPTTEATASETTPVQRRPGPPLGSRNNFRHGLRGTGLPAKCRKLETALNAFRRTVEDAVIDARGEIGLMDAAAINTAYRHERHALLAARWLNLNAEQMTHSERLQYSAAVASASSARDKALQSLNLNRDAGDAWAGLTYTAMEAKSDV